MNLYIEKYLRAKIKPYNGESSRNVCNNKITIAGSQFNCLLLILIDSAFRTSKSYYP